MRVEYVPSPVDARSPEADTVGVHLGAVVIATFITLSIFLLAIYLVATNWRDYRFILRAHSAPTKRHRWFSLRLNG